MKQIIIEDGRVTVYENAIESISGQPLILCPDYAIGREWGVSIIPLYATQDPLSDRWTSISWWALCASVLETYRDAIYGFQLFGTGKAQEFPLQWQVERALWEVWHQGTVPIASFPILWYSRSWVLTNLNLRSHKILGFTIFVIWNKINQILIMPLS